VLRAAPGLRCLIARKKLLSARNLDLASFSRELMSYRLTWENWPK
jgi:hypothetical protein